MASWGRVVEECSRGLEECSRALKEFLESKCPDPSMCEEPPKARPLAARYSWVESLVDKGVPDGRARLILYVLSRYLVNVKRLSPEEAVQVIGSFIEASCRNHGNCERIYASWVRSVVNSVARNRWLPWSLERIRERDPQLYRIIKETIGD